MKKINPIINLLAEKAVLITPNNRLSATLLEDYFYEYNQKAIEKPHCLPYSTFLINTFNNLVFQHSKINPPQLLTMLQCQYLWRQCLEQQDIFIFSEGLLNSVMDAWRNCMLWNISPEDPSFSYTPQTQQFQIWWQLFNQKLTEMNAITDYHILDYLFSIDYKWNHTHLIWMCFDNFTPQQKALQNYLTQCAIHQDFCDLTKIEEEQSFQCIAENTEEEKQHLMRFLKERLSLGDKSIGVIVPDLQQQAKSLHRFLLRSLPADKFNISLGKALYDFPLVTHGFNFLQLNHKKIKNHEAKILLISPYLAGAKQEFIQRTQCMQNHTQLEAPYFTLTSWIDKLNIDAPILGNLLTSIEAYPENAHLLEWINHFKNRLKKLGFPGDQGLDSENYQCYTRFITIFEEFAQLHLIKSQLSAQEALEVLKNIAKTTIFQAQTTPKSIQVLGLLEASGCQFDSIWVMGLTDQCLPEKTRLSPFIPHELQRQKIMPHSLPDKELTLGKQIIQRFKETNALSIFSYPELSAQSPNLPSPLIRDLPLWQPLPPNPSSNSAERILVHENYVLPINQKDKIKGGTSILANQAKCPFRAFAMHRLHAKASPKMDHGLNHLDKGQLIHRIMEVLWDDLGSQQILLSLSPEVLDAKVNRSIEQILLPLSYTKQHALPPLIQEIELNKLNRLVHACLNWERVRPEFKISFLEKSYSIELSGLDFNVRVDRLDRISENKTWVLDYKSSLPLSKPWNEDRPKEPQLLLYALLDQSIHGLVFLELKAGKVNASGYCDEKSIVNGITALKNHKNWEEQRSHWREILENLAQEIKDGICTPTPQTDVCNHCDFNNLCRICP